MHGAHCRIESTSGCLGIANFETLVSSDYLAENTQIFCNIVYLKWTTS